MKRQLVFVCILPRFLFNPFRYFFFNIITIQRNVQLRDLTSTLSYLLNIPVPFSNIGMPLLNVLNASYIKDYTEDLLSQVNAYLVEWNLINNRDLLRSFEEVKKVQSGFTQGEMIWWCCSTGLFSVIGGLFIRFPSPLDIIESLVPGVCVVSLFTSYTLIQGPLFPSLLIILVFSLVRWDWSKKHVFLLLSLLKPPPVVNMVFSIGVILSMVPFTLLNSLYIAVFACAFITKSTFFSCLMLSSFIVIWKLSLAPKRVILLFFVLLIILLHREYSWTLFCYYLVLIGMEYEENSWFLVTVGFFYTFLLTPTLTFSSLKWSAAFVFTHRTRFSIQGFSMILSVFWSFVGIRIMLGKEKLFIPVMTIVVASMITLGMNLATPVLWSVFTPVFLFVCVLWFLIVFC